MKYRISRDPLMKVRKRPPSKILQEGELVMTRTGVVMVWNAPLKPYHGLRKVRVLAGPELLTD